MKHRLVKKKHKINFTDFFVKIANHFQTAGNTNISIFHKVERRVMYTFEIHFTDCYVRFKMKFEVFILLRFFFSVQIEEISYHRYLVLLNERNTFYHSTTEHAKCIMTLLLISIFHPKPASFFLVGGGVTSLLHRPCC